MKSITMFMTLILLVLTWTPTINAQNSGDDALLQFIHSLDQHRALRHYKAEPFSDDAYKKAFKGEVITRMVDAENGEKVGVAIKIFNAPLWQVWAATTNRRDYVKYSDDLKASDILNEMDGLVTVYHYASAFGVKRNWVLDTHANDNLYKTSEGKMWEYYWSINPQSKTVIAEGIDSGKIQKISKKDFENAVLIEKNNGAFLMIGLPDGRTLVEGYSNNDPGGNIPKFIADKMAKKSIPDTLNSIEKFIQTQFDTLLASDLMVIGPDGKLVPPKMLKPQ